MDKDFQPMAAINHGTKQKESLLRRVLLTHAHARPQWPNSRDRNPHTALLDDALESCATAFSKARAKWLMINWLQIYNSWVVGPTSYAIYSLWQVCQYMKLRYESKVFSPPKKEPCPQQVADQPSLGSCSSHFRRCLWHPARFHL